LHQGLSRRDAADQAVEMLRRVYIPEPERRAHAYPHQLSGGMRQRAMIAMALSCDPKLLIADEPTTALDVTVQAQILDLISDLQQEFGSAVIIITHDLGLVAELSDDILVMYAGRCVEYGSAEDIFSRPAHPYAWGLLASMPRLDEARSDRLIPIEGTPPSLINVPSGCPFHPRCQYAGRTGGKSENEVPLLKHVSPGHRWLCHPPRRSDRGPRWAGLRRAGARGSMTRRGERDQLSHRPATGRCVPLDDGACWR
jgi:peptide/nickel transport system ATP-binding protein